MTEKKVKVCKRLLIAIDNIRKDRLEEGLIAISREASIKFKAQLT